MATYGFSFQGFKNEHFNLKNNPKLQLLSVGAELWGAGDERSTEHSEGCDQIIKKNKEFWLQPRADSLELTCLPPAYLRDDKLGRAGGNKSIQLPQPRGSWKEPGSSRSLHVVGEKVAPCSNRAGEKPIFS